MKPKERMEITSLQTKTVFCLPVMSLQATDFLGAFMPASLMAATPGCLTAD